MNLQQWPAFLMWCTILNLGLFIFSVVVYPAAKVLIARLHCPWFDLPREQIGTIYYGFLGIYKLLILMFNFIPWLALLIIGNG